MATTTPSEHLSIGEVLATLRDEFPDITISKIRFLESQGLIDPERTPSGYRKFYGPDIDRLRWILHQQKENFLPLKVIKGRLEDAGPDGLPADEGPVAAEADGDNDAKPSKAASKTASSRAAAKDSDEGASADAKAKPPNRRSKSAAPKPKPRSATSKAKVRPPTEDTPTLSLDDGEPDDLEPTGGGRTLTRAELATESGLTSEQVNELDEFGLLEPAGTGGDRMLFDEDALEVAKLAAGFAQHGIEARHLRMYRTFAERDATLYGQVIQGVLRQRNPEARARARADLVELAGLGRSMRSAFLRRAVDDLLPE
jgi:DNA-binding transcriptional MerR regulator